MGPKDENPPPPPPGPPGFWAQLDNAQEQQREIESDLADLFSELGVKRGTPSEVLQSALKPELITPMPTVVPAGASPLPTQRPRNHHAHVTDLLVID